METKTMLKIEDLKKDLYVGDLGEYFVDYDNGYICDIITEIADNQIDIYTNDLLEWAKNNYSYIESAIDELGTPTDSNGRADFLKMIQQGQFYYNEQQLYSYLEDALKFRALEYIERDLEIKEITEEQFDEILNTIDFTDNNEELENILETVKEILEGQN